MTIRPIMRLAWEGMLYSASRGLTGQECTALEGFRKAGNVKATGNISRADGAPNTRPRMGCGRELSDIGAGF